MFNYEHAIIVHVLLNLALSLLPLISDKCVVYLATIITASWETLITITSQIIAILKQLYHHFINKISLMLICLISSHRLPMPPQDIALTLGCSSIELFLVPFKSFSHSVLSFWQVVNNKFIRSPVKRNHVNTRVLVKWGQYLLLGHVQLNLVFVLIRFLKARQVPDYKTICRDCSPQRWAKIWHL